MGPAANPGPSASVFASASAPAPAPAAEDVPKPSRASSFFSRFSLPLRSRPPRNVADFHIRPAEPHRHYQAGDSLLGAVILTVIKPVRITHLTVSLHGYVRVYKGPAAAAANGTSPVNPAEIPSGRTAFSRFRYHGNGHVSLFHDEQVLSADGKLDPGKYEFNFDLMFPAKGLPSSIDFERGTISYLITATLTRPVATEPTISCARRVTLVDRLDVGSLTPPPPRTIHLEPKAKRPKKRRHQLGPGGPNDMFEPGSDLDVARTNGNSIEGPSSVTGDDHGQDGTNPRTPTHSDIRSVSGDSARSGSTGYGRGGNGETNHDSQRRGGSVNGSRKSLPEDRTITATIEVQRGGCLPGDVVPVKISVQHVKPIKSMHGVIATLYRQGRIDTSPPLPLQGLSREEVKQLEKEEFFPRSKTGLGGLSLSAAGSRSVFRKDLSQSFSPLIIDPMTLTATVTTSVRVPEDVFPSIKGVPGDMVTFKYILEVIVDLGGKLASQLQGGGGSSSGRVHGAPLSVLGSFTDRTGSGPMATWGTGIVDTEPVRRERGVISLVFEVIVGTTDSNRKRGKAVRLQSSLSNPDGGGRPNEETFSIEDYAVVPLETPPPDPHYFVHDSTAASEYIPPPQIPDLAALTEKELIRRAEQRLLPSQPEARGSRAATGSSAPSQPLSHDVAGAQDFLGSHSAAGDAEGPSAPTLEEVRSRWTGRPGVDTEDKQELERRRLLAEASAPPDFPEDYDDGATAAPAGPGGLGNAGVTSAPLIDEPSAPVLTEDDEYGYGDTTRPAFAGSRVAGPEEPLPRYER